jgi:hypothetical protein
MLIIGCSILEIHSKPYRTRVLLTSHGANGMHSPESARSRAHPDTAAPALPPCGSVAARPGGNCSRTMTRPAFTPDAGPQSRAHTQNQYIRPIRGHSSACPAPPPQIQPLPSDPSLLRRSQAACLRHATPYDLFAPHLSAIGPYRWRRGTGAARPSAVSISLRFISCTHDSSIPANWLRRSLSRGLGLSQGLRANLAESHPARTPAVAIQSSPSSVAPPLTQPAFTPSRTRRDDRDQHCQLERSGKPASAVPHQGPRRLPPPQG